MGMTHGIKDTTLNRIEDAEPVNGGTMRSIRLGGVRFGSKHLTLPPG